MKKMVFGMSEQEKKEKLLKDQQALLLQIQAIEKLEADQRAIEQMKAHQRAKDEKQYQKDCSVGKIDQPASVRYEAYLRYILNEKNNYDVHKTGLAAIRQAFRVTKLCEYLDTLDEAAQREVKYSE